jgi:transcriptional regulator with XRE-family HTH domain
MKLRRSAFLSQKEVARKLDISLQEYRDVENGSSYLSTQHLITLASSLGVTVTYLIRKC